MSDYLTESPAAPADGYLSQEPSGGYLDEAPLQESYLDATEPQAWSEQPPAPAPYNPPMQQGFAPAPVTMQDPAGNLTIQAPYLDEVQPSRNTVGASTRDISTLLLDVEVPVEVYFGDAALTVEEFLDLGPGSVVELDHTIEAPIELRVRGKLVATGQLVTINGNFGLRITSTVEKH